MLDRSSFTCSEAGGCLDRELTVSTGEDPAAAVFGHTEKGARRHAAKATQRRAAADAPARGISAEILRGDIYVPEQLWKPSQKNEKVVRRLAHLHMAK